MPYRLSPFADLQLTEARLRSLLSHHQRSTRPRLNRLWNYYRNGPDPARARHPDQRGPTASTLAQAAGLPVRLASRPTEAEIVIENDIGWRIHTMVEFMFGRPPRLICSAPDPQRARAIERVLGAVWDASGGIGLLQDLALLAHIYGQADLLLRIPPEARRGAVALTADLGGEETPPLAADLVRIELVEPTRAVAMLNASDYRSIDAFIITQVVRDSGPEPAAAPPAPSGSAMGRLLARLNGHAATANGIGSGPGAARIITEILSARHRQVYLTEGLSPNAEPHLLENEPLPIDLGRPPVVHIQNLSQPFAYEGLSEVEPLIPLQDELNTRLSDRASRVTMQSFRMYLAKGIDGFDGVPIGPGRVWSTDNPDATVQAFGGDAASPSEDRHIEEIREALDKVSGVPPLATGVVRAKVGNLTSENALRITLTGLLSRTARKRITYGRGLAEMSTLVLDALDALGAFRTDPAERHIRVEWPDPLPRDERNQLESAQLKRDLGIPQERILAELGYAPAEPGV